MKKIIDVEKMKYGSVLKRFLAMVIDGMILSSVSNIVTYLIALVSGKTMGDLVSITSSINFLLAWAYYATLESSDNCGTLGKQVMGLVVVSEDGYQLTLSKASVRFLSKILSSMILMIGFFMAFFTKKHQSLHDKIAKSVVISRR